MIRVLFICKGFATPIIFQMIFIMYLTMLHQGKSTRKFLFAYLTFKGFLYRAFCSMTQPVLFQQARVRKACSAFYAYERVFPVTMFYQFMPVKLTCAIIAFVTIRTFIIAFFCMHNFMQLQDGRVRESTIALIAFIWHSILGVFAFPVLIKSVPAFERLCAIRTFFARFCCMYCACMSFQIRGGRKCLLALIAFMFLFMIAMFVDPVSLIEIDCF